MRDRQRLSHITEPSEKSTSKLLRLPNVQASLHGHSSQRKRVRSKAKTSVPMVAEDDDAIRFDGAADFADDVPDARLRQVHRHVQPHFDRAGTTAI